MTTMNPAHGDQRRYATAAAALVALVLLIVASFSTVNLQWAALLEPDASARAADFLKAFATPNLSGSFLGRVAYGAAQTLAISIVSTGLAAVFGAVLALPASSPQPMVRGLTRGLLNFLRAVPELVWAAILVIAVGLGPFAGTLALLAHTTGVLGRLFAETLENLPQASTIALRDNGVAPTARFLYATLPEALAQYISYTLYRWENNIRAATILGIVGAGGLGQLLFYNLSLFRMDNVSTVIVAMILIVLAVDRLSYEARRWLEP